MARAQAIHVDQQLADVIRHRQYFGIGRRFQKPLRINLPDALRIINQGLRLLICEPLFASNEGVRKARPHHSAAHVIANKRRLA